MAPRSDDGDDLPPSTPDTARKEHYGDEQAEARQAALEKELRGVRSINEVIEGVIGSLEKAKGNMETVSKTVDNASTLLNTWTRILSQTEHNQRLILNPDWNGATQDLTDIESEAIEKEQAAQRRAAEEERRKAEARRQQEDEERRRQAAATGSSRGHTRGSRSRGRAGYYTRGGGSSSSGTLGRSSSTRGGGGGSGGSGRYGNTRYGRVRGTTK